MFVYETETTAVVFDTLGLSKELLESKIKNKTIIPIIEKQRTDWSCGHICKELPI